MLCNYITVQKTQNIKVTAKQSQGRFELKQRKPLFREEYLQGLVQRKQVKYSWLWDPKII